MTVKEFQKQPRGPYAFDRWIWDNVVVTSLGDFSVEFDMLGTDDTDPPDAEMLKRASELVGYAEAHDDFILDIVFGSYLVTPEDWLEVCDVPGGLTKETIVGYVETRRLVVARHLDWEKPYDSAINITPLWDEEHALSLAFRDGEVASVNDSPFRIESGVLRCD